MGLEYKVLLPCWSDREPEVKAASTGLPAPSTGLGRRADEVRGQSSFAVSASATDTVFVEAAKDLPARGIKNLPAG